MKLEVADPLVERAVELAVAGAEDETVYRRERDRCYAVRDPEDRDAAFRRLHRRWFVARDLERPIREALSELPAVAARATRLSVTLAARARDEGAELYVAPGDSEPSRVVVVRLLAATMLDRPRLGWLLRRELLHVADMLDPAFGYRPQLPPSSAGPIHDELLRQRYAALWSTSVAGRLARRGDAPEGIEEPTRSRFARTFSMLGDAAAAVFDRLWQGERPTHEALVQLASEPTSAGGTGWRCGICGFPTARPEDRCDLEAEVVAHLRRERPAWRPADGLCPRCADLYRVRAGVFGRAGLLGTRSTTRSRAC